MGFRAKVSRLSQLRDVDIAGAAAGEALADDGTGLWVPTPASAIAGAVSNGGGVTKLQAGTLAARPAAAAFGQGIYVTTDTFEVYYSNGVAWSLSDPLAPYLWAYRSANQNVESAATTEVDYDVAPVSRGTWVRSGGKFTVPTAGLYMISASVNMTSNVVGRRLHQLVAAGSIIDASYGGQVDDAGVPYGRTFKCGGPFYLAAGAQVYQSIFQESGSPVGIGGNPTSLRIARISL